MALQAVVWVAPPTLAPAGLTLKTTWKVW